MSLYGDGPQGDDRPPFITVAICTYNKAATLELALSSVSAQNHPSDRYEVTVVDDGSRDGTRDLVESVRERVTSPKIRYIRQPHKGLSAARNLAIESTDAPLICFVDDDVEAPAHWLSSIVEGTERHPDAGILGGRIYLRVEGRAPRTCGAEPLGGSLDLGDADLSVERVKGGNMCLRRSVLESVGGFNELLTWRGDEEEWQIRLLESGGKIVYLPEAWLWHRRTADDVKLLRLLKARFGWGYGHVLYCREAGRPLGMWRDVFRGIFFQLAHAVRRRCTGGILQATVRVGMLWAILRGELRSVKRDR